MSTSYGIKCQTHTGAHTFGKTRGEKTAKEIIAVAPDAKKVLTGIEDSELHVLGWYNDVADNSLDAFLIEHGDCPLVVVDEHGRSPGDEGY